MDIVKDSKSFEGWSFRNWFMGNWKSIKELAKVGIPMIVGWVATKDVTASGFITILGKFLLDSGQYYFKANSKK